MVSAEAGLSSMQLVFLFDLHRLVVDFVQAFFLRLLPARDFIGRDDAFRRQLRRIEGRYGLVRPESCGP